MAEQPCIPEPSRSYFTSALYSAVQSSCHLTSVRESGLRLVLVAAVNSVGIRRKGELLPSPDPTSDPGRPQCSKCGGRDSLILNVSPTPPGA